MNVVATLTSAALSRWQSSIVRTEWPTSSPMSQRKVRNRSMPSSPPGTSVFGSRISTSMSEQGCSSPRP